MDPLIAKALPGVKSPLGGDSPEGDRLKGLVPDLAAPQEMAWTPPEETPTPAPEETPTPEDSAVETKPVRKVYPVPGYKAPEPRWGFDEPESNSSQSESGSSSEHHSGGQIPHDGDDDFRVHQECDDQHGDSDHHHGSQLAYLDANPEAAFPPFKFSRQGQPDGFFFESTQTSGKYQAFSTDHLFCVANTFKPLAQEETIFYDFYAPAGAQTQNKNGRGAAASVEYRYRANSAISTSALDSKYTLEIRVYNDRYPSGARIFYKEEPQFLPQLKAAARVAMRDQGDWTVKITRNGTQVSSDLVAVTDQLPPVGWIRKVNKKFKAPNPDLTFYTNDESVHYTASYPIPAAPSGSNGSQTFQVQWDLRSPDAAFNKNQRNAYWSLTSVYQTNGTSWNVTNSVADSIYHKARIFQTRTGQGTLDHLDLSYGKGLPTYGNWQLNEKVGSAATKATTLSVRQLNSSVKLVTPGLYVSSGASVPYQLTVSSKPSSWTADNVTWNLKLTDSGGSVLRTYTGSLASLNGEKSWIQVWDGKTDSGAPVGLGKKINPVFSVGVVGPPGDPPFSVAVNWVNQALSAPSGTHTVYQSSSRDLGITTDFGPSVPGGKLYAAGQDTIRPFQEPFLDLIPPENLLMRDFSLDPGSNGYTKLDPFALTETSMHTVVNITGRIRVSVESIIPYFSDQGPPADDSVSISLGNLGDESTYSVSGQPSFVNTTTTFPVDGIRTGTTRVQNIAPGVTQTISSYLNPDPVGIGDQHQTFGLSIQQRSLLVDLSRIIVILVVFDVQSSNQDQAVAAVIFSESERCNLCDILKTISAVLQQSSLFSSPVAIDVSNTSGRYRHYFTDLAFPTRGLPLSISRAYTSDEQKAAPRYGWNWNFQDRLLIEPNSNQVYHQNEPGQSMDIYGAGGSGYVAFDGSNTDVLTKLDGAHFQIAHKSHVRCIYEAVSPSTTMPYEAVLKQEIDQNGNTNTFTWSADGKRLLKMQGPDPSQFITLRWSNDRGPDKCFDHTGRCVTYRYRPYNKTDECREEADTDWLLAEVEQPGHKVYRHGYHKVLGERNYQLLTTALNGILQEKAVGQEDQTGVLQEVTHREGATLSFARDNSGSSPVTTLTMNAPSGMPQGQAQVWKYTLDGSDRIKSGIGPQGKSASVVYDQNHNVTGGSDPLGHQIRQTFDSRNNVLTSTDSLNRTTTMTWDSNDNCTSVRDALGQTTTMAFDSHQNLISVTDPAQHTQRISWTDFGKPLSVTDNLGHTAYAGYNNLGFLTSVTLPPAAPGQPAAVLKYSVDTLGRRTASEDPLHRIVRVKYDERNRVVESVIPGVSSRFKQGELALGHTFAQFDNNDLLLASKSLDGLVTSYEYDSAHRLVAVHKPGFERPTRLKYDVLEHVVELVNSNAQSTKYQFDTLNRPIKMIYPGGDSESYTFDSNDNVVSWNRGSHTVSYEYDSLDRLKHLSSPATHDDIQLDYDELDRVIGMTDNTGTTNYHYTNNYLLDRITRPGNKVLQYGFDAGDRMITMVDPENLTTSYDYSDRNELLAVHHDQQSARFDHDIAGRTVATHYSNGVDAVMDYSERDQLLFKSYFRGRTPLLTLKYAFDQVGHRVLDERTDPQGTVLKRYRYNQRRQMVESTRTNSRGCETTSYRFDQNGNIVDYNGVPFSSNGNDQLTKAGDANLQYNAAGQATRAGQTTLDFNYRDQVTAVHGNGLEATYLYDGNGQRVQKTVNGKVQKFLWSGDSIAKEYTDAGAVRADFQLGAGAKIDGKWQFYLSDIQGSTLGVTDERGQMQATWSYSDYGVTTQTSGSANLYQPFLYTHSQFDAETGWYYNKARHYAPKFGKFLSRDPIGYAGGPNVYAYCGGNPVDASDPSGEFLQGAAVLAGIGLIFEAYYYLSGTYDQLESQSFNRDPVTGLDEGFTYGRTPVLLQVVALAPAARFVSASTLIPDSANFLLNGIDLDRLPPGVVRTADGGLDFENSAFLYPVEEGQQNVVKIEYTGSRSGDFRAADVEAKITNRPADATWHHASDYDPQTNTGTMQLVDRATHATIRHSGGVSQCKSFWGLKQYP